MPRFNGIPVEEPIAPMTTAAPDARGLVQPGNIDLAARPVVKNADGSISTVRSMSFDEDGREILVPTVSPDGKILSDDDAIKLYHQTGQHLGMFDNPDDATSYAQTLHVQQSQMYSPSDNGAKPRFKGVPIEAAGANGQDGGFSLDNIGRTFARGAIGIGSYLDEADAATNAALAPYIDPLLPDSFQKLPGKTYGERYDQALAIQRDKDKAFDAQNPVTSTGLQLAGAVGSGVGLAKALPAVTGAVEGVLTAPASTLGRVGVGAGLGAAGGAAEGAISGFGNGEGGLSNRLNSARDTAGIGLVGGMATGAAMPVVAPLIGKAARSVLDNFTVNQAAKKAGLSGPSARILNDALEADSAFNGRGARNLAAAGDEAMLADAGSATQNLVDTAIQQGGKGANIARDAIDARAARARQTLNTALDDGLGSVDGAALPSRKGRPDLGQAYDRAYKAPIDYSRPEAMAIEQMVSSRVPGEAISAANKLMRTEGHSSAQILAKVADDGSVKFFRQPDVRQLDYITRGLKQVADEADGKGKLGGTTAIGRAYGSLATEIRSNLKTLVPEYGEALNAAGTEIGRKNARDFGYDMLSKGVRRSDVREFAHDLPDVERAELKSGIRNSVDDAMANVHRAIADPNMDAREAVAAVKQLSSRANIDKLTDAIGQREAWKLAAEVSKAAKSLEMRANVAGNSRTFARDNARRIVKETVEPGILGRAMQGKPLDALKSGLQVLTNQTPADVLAKERAIYAEVAEALTNSRGDDAHKVLQTLQSIHARNPENEALAQLIQRYGVVATAVPTYRGASDGVSLYTGAAR